MPEPSSRAPSPAVVLVTGSGRSGTSSLAGSLRLLGLRVPQPEVPASRTNPRGFFEPQWVVDFHKSRLKRLGLHNIDGRPWAADLVAESLQDPASEQELTAWLREEVPAGSGRADGHPAVVVKDPHAFWFADVWRRSAATLGLDLGFLTALRHPAEVAGSRDLAYLQQQPPETRRGRETANIAGWVQAALLTERASREHRRAFVRYTDLVEDWRTALGRAGAQLGLDVADQVALTHHPIDDFLDPGMRKARLGWDDVEVPPRLRDLAQQVWELMEALVLDPDDARARAGLDEAGEAYDRLYRESTDIAWDHVRAREALLAAAHAEEVERLRRRLRRARREATARAGTEATQSRGTRGPDTVPRAVRAGRRTAARAARWAARRLPGRDRD